MLRTKAALTLTSGLLLHASGVSAQSEAPQQERRLQLEEVVVTAQKRAESLSDVPVSVTALSGDKLRDAGIANMSDLSEYTPNFKLVEGGLIPNIYMRGVGSGSNQGFELSVGIFSDGVHLGRPHQTRGAFMDLERVEVLRGPQSILFGKNAIAGALSLISGRPGDELEASISGMIGGPDDKEEFNAMVSTPVTDNFGVRAAVRQRREDGYLKNENPAVARDEPGIEEFSGRITFGWHPGDMVESYLKLEQTNREQKGRHFEMTHESALTGCSGENIGLDGIKNTDAAELAEIDSYNYTLSVDFNLDAGTLSFVSAASGFESEDLFDADSSSFNTVPLFGGEEYDQVSHEIRFASPGAEFIDYIGGIFYQTGELTFFEQTPLILRNGALADARPAPGGCNTNTTPIPGGAADLEKDFFVESEAISAFVQVTFNWNESLRTTLGLRYVEEEKEGFRQLFIYDSGTRNDVNPVTGGILESQQIKAHTLANNREVGATLPSINFQWDANEDIMTYVTYTQGAKSGGFDARGNNDFGGPRGGGTSFEFEDEEADAYEVGAKMRLADGAADLNIAAYYVEYNDMQVSVFDGVAGFVVTNAASAITKGVEIDGRWLLTEWFMLSGSAAYLDFEWAEYLEGPCPANDPQDRDICDLTGKPNQQTPEWTATVSGAFTFPLPGDLMLGFNVDVSYKDTHYTSGDLDARGIQPAYTKVNARLGISDIEGDWSVALVGKNLTDELTIGIGSPTVLDVGGYRATVEPFRDIHLEARARF